MIDRESTFADPGVVELLKTRTIPVAIDQWNQRRQKDSEGEFYRKIARQGPRHDFENGTTQGLYLAAPDGTFLGYTNNRDPRKVRQMLETGFSIYRPGPTAVLNVEKVDARFNAKPPEGGLVVRVCAKVLGGYDEPTTQYEEIFQTALSRDNLWITADEHQTLVSGRFSDSLAQRIALFHLVDNTRGEPPFWKSSEVMARSFTLHDSVITGSVELKTQDGQRSYSAVMRGHITVTDRQITAFDLVVSGTFSGHGPYTGRAPEQPFPLAISFTLADGTDIADTLPPQAGRGWLGDYLK
ncbi:MAG: hypothetical protein R3C49_01835 [Planctomycetaceae bacterium]